ncbi:ciga protein [Gigaspora margarita]|uniref:Ciga protein n=1 Tax=Gigaspora margarita TaxID=4874 RepID=A0A8H4EN71_GIGMA|nr:ciga protein [Gigaspora margarita]
MHVFQNFLPRRLECIVTLKILFTISWISYFIFEHESEMSWNFNNFSTIQTTDQEKYLTYLPHSGFHNQRISLINAIFLAWFLNRTLIIPPPLLYKNHALIPMRYFDRLYKDLSKLKLCKNNSLKNFNEESYIGYDWEELMDFTFLKRNIKYFKRRDFNFTQLIKSLHINNDNDVYNITDNQLQFYDSSVSIDEYWHFTTRINLIDLSKRPEKLLHFGSLFSSYKIITRLPENENFRNKLNHTMLPNNPTILKIVNRIVDRIGGTDNYIGVHARIGKGFLNQNETMQNLTEVIQNDFKDIDVKNSNACLQTKIFLATDVPRNISSIQLFFQTFPCVYMLDDFDDLLEPLKSLKNPNDGMIMFEFLIPFVDLLVVSMGNKFYKTYSSTFSKYAQFLNQIWLEDKQQNI